MLFALCLSQLLFGHLTLALLLLGLGRRVGVRGAARLGAAQGVASLLGLALVALQGRLAEGGVTVVSYGLWFAVGTLRAEWTFGLDGAALAMAALVVTVSAVTATYSHWYLATDPALVRFQGYLAAFTGAMLLLVCSGNFAVLFLGWEGIGLCSFLLIGFWSSRPEARLAALKAVTLNRVGDGALLGAVGLLASLSGSLEFSTNFLLAPLAGAVGVPLPTPLGGGSAPLAEVVGALLLVAIGAKSAQLGLHGWLADAMEGPTPVSALIHAATLVTAGIFLALRCTPIFGVAPAAAAAGALLGATTALYGAAVACGQWDLKKIIAYSTCSQLGYMLCAATAGGGALALGHLLSHGFFKALLFLAAGVLIHALGGEQDLRRMGGLRPLLPLTFSYFAVGQAALLGLPGTAGAASKERLLDLLVAGGTPIAAACYWLLWGALVCTTYYSAKVFYWAFLGEYRGSRPPLAAAAAGPELAPLPLVGLGLLALLALGGDALLRPLGVNLGGALLQRSGLGGELGAASLYAEALASGARWRPFAAMALGLTLFGTLTFGWGSERGVTLAPTLAETPAAALRRTLRRALARGGHWDSTLMSAGCRLLRVAVAPALALEKGLLEWAGPSGLGAALGAAGRRLELANVGRSPLATVALLAVALLATVALALGGVATGWAEESAGAASAAALLAPEAEPPTVALSVAGGGPVVLAARNPYPPCAPLGHRR